MIDTAFIGAALPVFGVEVDAGRLRFFAKAIGEENPVYTDANAARAAGFSGIPLPPTFLFCLEMDSPNPAAMRDMLNIDYSRILHGEQHFTYHKMAYVGDRLTFSPRIADIYAKKGGALAFVVRETGVTDQNEELVAVLRCITIVRNGRV